MIAKEREIDARTKWDPIPDTMSLDLVTIRGISQGQTLFQMQYPAGWPFDVRSDQVVRFGKPAADDPDWMCAHIWSRISPSPAFVTNDWRPGLSRSGGVLVLVTDLRSVTVSERVLAIGSVDAYKLQHPSELVYDVISQSSRPE